ncbi:hypothetical protein PFISCL1PPCAC_18019, partial [Pristionchus fissidentatus]
QMLVSIRGGSFFTRRPPPSDLSSSSSSSSSIRSVLYSFNPALVSLSTVDGVAPKIWVSQISIGARHSVLIISPDHSVYSWGANQQGQVFLADRGTLLVCGCRKMSGNGKEVEDQLEPQLVTSILRMDIVDVSAGDEHVVAVASDGALRLPPKPLVIGARCGPNASALITDDGSIMACGSNRYNKLNLAQRLGFFGHHRSQANSKDILSPTPVPCFPERVVDVSLGQNHTGGKLVLESGLVYMFGMNLHGELGNGGLLPPPVGSNVPVKALFNKGVVMLTCGDGFTLAATVENELFFWGSKGTLPIRPAITLEDIDLTASYTNTRVVKLKPPPTAKSKWSALKRKSDAEAIDVVEQIIPIPSMVLRLDNSADPSNSIRLAHLASSGKRVYVSIDTTVPMKIDTIPRTKRFQRQHSAPNLTEDSAQMQTWLRRELDQGERIPIPGYLAKSTANLRETQNTLTLNESKKLHAEIEALKKQMQEQSYRSQGHAEQMSAMQSKLGELQARQSFLRRTGVNSSPPPEYTLPSTPKKIKQIQVVYNGFFPEQQKLSTDAAAKVESRACCIL